MVKAFRTTSPPAAREQYRIGISEDNLWNPNDDRFKVLCRTVHVAKAALNIGYCQLLISMVFTLYFGYYYLLAVSGAAAAGVSGDFSTTDLINQYSAKYASQFLFAVAVQLVLILVMIHGVRSENRSFLLPYIVFSVIAIIAGLSQLGSDFVSIRSSADSGSLTNEDYSQQQTFLSHLVATFIHAWCLSVVWRCYGFLGEKKVARQISEQLSATNAAFHYPERYYSYVLSQPPAYSETVQSSGGSGRIIKIDDDKQPLTVA